MAQTSDSILSDRFESSQRFTTLRDIYDEARNKVSPSTWEYIWTGTGDERTLERNSAKFDEVLWDAPLFTGLRCPDTSVEFMGQKLSFPVLTASFGLDTVFHPEGHRAVGRAAESVGIRQMVPVGSTLTLEEAAGASSVADYFQHTLVGRLEDSLQMMDRVVAAGYSFVIASFSPIKQWRERLMRSRFSPRGIQDTINYSQPGMDAAPMEELIQFREPRWTWADAAEFIKRCPLPVIVKGVQTPAAAAMQAGAAGVYVSNYGGRTVDRTLSAIEALPMVRQEVGPQTPIIFDSGVRRGSDVAAALALGADVVAIGRLAVLGLAADGEEGVRRVLQILQDEFWSTLGHLGCSSPKDLGPHVIRACFDIPQHYSPPLHGRTP